MMGASDKDKATPLTEWDIPSELPRHEVVIDDPIAIGKYEVTVEEFEAYVQETGAEVGGICGIAVVQSGPHARKFTGTKHPKSDAFSQTPNLVYIADGSYAQPGLPISPRQPAVCVSRNEVRGYLNWLSSKTGRIYRLPSEAEWEYAARAGTQTVAFWGDDLSLACDYANFGDRASGYQAGFAAPCSEDVRPLWTAEVGSYEPNDWGLHDMAGNVTEMLQDCWHENYQGAPADGSAWEEEDCLLFVARGGDYGSLHISTRAADRGFFGYVEEVPQIEGKEVSHDGRSNLVGFRVAASMTDTASAAPPPPDNASSQAPSRAGAPAVTWTAASGTAIAITGNLTVSGDELIFGDGTRLALDFVAEEQSVWAAGGVSTGRIFRLDPPRDPVLLNGSTLCGMPEPVTYLVLSEPSPDSLALTVFTSPSPPSGFGDRSCATYFYQR